MRLTVTSFQYWLLDFSEKCSVSGVTFTGDRWPLASWMGDYCFSKKIMDLLRKTIVEGRNR